MRRSYLARSRTQSCMVMFREANRVLCQVVIDQWPVVSIVRISRPLATCHTIRLQAHSCPLGKDSGERSTHRLRWY